MVIKNDESLAKKLQSLINLSQIINSLRNLDEVLENILISASEVMHCEGCSILLIESGTDYLYFRAATGEKKDDIKRYRLKLGEGIAGWVALFGEPLLVPDVKKDKRFKESISKELNYPTKDILCVPLIYRGKITGTLEVVNSFNREHFTEEDIPILQTFANGVAIAIENAKYVQDLSEENIKLKRELDTKFSFDDIIGKNSNLLKMIEIAKRIADANVTVLIRGESGTGKELLAQSIHNASSRRNKPFIAVNCAAIPETLLESELFGYEKGAFTGAFARKPGKFELAHYGTVFLDEIGELSPKLQVKLLRILQERIVERIGGNEGVPVDVRIIAATNKNLEEEIKIGMFREDLFYRINVITLKLPALCERMEDIPLLVNYFINKHSRRLNIKTNGIDKEAVEMLMQYNWPGNIRELENVIERAVVLAGNDMITKEYVALRSVEQSMPEYQPNISLKDAQLRFKKKFIKLALERNDRNQSKTAKELKIQRTYLSRLIKELNATP
ncbi:MAG: sigma 54-interacting transcriptional regulator [Candidatus Hydrogenedentota bacterium]